MKVKSIYIHTSMDEKGFTAKAEIDVPGLGIVKFDHAMSEDLITNIRDETIAALRHRMGQTINTKECQVCEGLGGHPTGDSTTKCGACNGTGEKQ